MIKFAACLKAVLLFTVSGLPSALFANPVGQVVEVAQDAVYDRGGQRSQLQTSQSVNIGDIISTGPTGQVQLVFQDNTRIAISANSRLVIDNVLFGTPETTGEFAVNAVGGAFRFLSGNTAKEAYAITTPNGTMGIRGTIFDFSVIPSGIVNLVTFEGEVEFCSLTNRCARVSGGCAAVALNNDDEFFIPEDRDGRLEFLNANFPYVFNQEILRSDFRARTETCNRQDVLLPQRTPSLDRQRSRSAPDPVPTPEPAPPPRTPGGGGAQSGGNGNDAGGGTPPTSGNGGGGASAGGGARSGAGAGGN